MWALTLWNSSIFLSKFSICPFVKIFPHQNFAPYGISSLHGSLTGSDAIMANIYQVFLLQDTHELTFQSICGTNEACTTATSALSANAECSAAMHSFNTNIDVSTVCNGECSALLNNVFNNCEHQVRV